MHLVKFLDGLNCEHYGIMLPDGEYLICGCCGGLLDLENVEILDEAFGEIEKDLRRYFE